MVSSIVAFLFIAFFGILSLALFAFWVWTLIDVVSNEPSEGNDKLIWILVIIFAGGVGSAIYFFVRRPQRIKMYGK